MVPPLMTSARTSTADPIGLGGWFLGAIFSDVFLRNLWEAQVLEFTEESGLIFARTPTGPISPHLSLESHVLTCI